MIVARWHIDARFGHKQAVIDALKAWNRNFGEQIGWNANQLRLTTGSIGALESTVEMEITLADLAEVQSLVGQAREDRGSQAVEHGSRATRRLRNPALGSAADTLRESAAILQRAGAVRHPAGAPLRRTT